MNFKLLFLSLIIGSVISASIPKLKNHVCPINGPISCQVKEVENTCCTEFPGGQILLTQFWDWVSPYAGPKDLFTLHGLWPDRCTSGFDQFCDKTMFLHKPVHSILLENGESELLEEMKYKWVDNRGPKHQEEFYKHETDKHMTCYSTLKPSCNTDLSLEDITINYFKTVLEVFNKLPTYDFLAKHGITPSIRRKYKLADIKSALSSEFGFEPTLHCNGGGNKLHEVWYYFHLQGPLVGGKFYPTSPSIQKDSCKSEVFYYPKYKFGRHHAEINELTNFDVFSDLDDLTIDNALTDFTLNEQIITID